MWCCVSVLVSRSLRIVSLCVADPVPDAAGAGQSTFLWQVSGPCFSSESFLAAAITRYDQFLCLMGVHGYRNMFYVPSYDVDLCWHTHMLISSSLYLEETRLRAGEPVDHDDSVNDRRTGSMLNRAWEDTKSTWFETFGNTVKPIDAPGTCYRGEPPASWFRQQLAAAPATDDGRVRVYDDLLDKEACLSLLALVRSGKATGKGNDDEAQDEEQNTLLCRQDADDFLGVEVPVALYGRLLRLLSAPQASLCPADGEDAGMANRPSRSATNTLPVRVSSRDVPVHRDSFIHGECGPVHGRVGIVYLAGLGTMTFVCVKSGQVRVRDDGVG